MRLYLDFVDGPDAGRRLSFSSSATLGRKGADIEIADPKLSEVHAFFEFDGRSTWVVRDNQSRNGVWINGLKETKAILKEGDQLQLGSHNFICRLIQSSQVKYKTDLQKELYEHFKSLTNEKSDLKEVKPEMRLKFIQGVQFGQHWDIFYGPRHIGKKSLDLCLMDENAPEEAFEIHLKGTYPYFFTENPAVLINGEAVASKQLTPGDIISIGENQLQVEFDEGHGFSH